MIWIKLRFNLICFWLINAYCGWVKKNSAFQMHKKECSFSEWWAEWVRISLLKISKKQLESKQFLIWRCTVFFITTNPMLLWSGFLLCYAKRGLKERTIESFHPEGVIPWLPKCRRFHISERRMCSSCSFQPLNSDTRLPRGMLISDNCDNIFTMSMLLF